MNTSRIEWLGLCAGALLAEVTVAGCSRDGGVSKHEDNPPGVSGASGADGQNAATAHTAAGTRGTGVDSVAGAGHAGVGTSGAERQGGSGNAGQEEMAGGGAGALGDQDEGGTGIFATSGGAGGMNPGASTGGHGNAEADDQVSSAGFPSVAGGAGGDGLRALGSSGEGSLTSEGGSAGSENASSDGGDGTTCSADPKDSVCGNNVYNSHGCSTCSTAGSCKYGSVTIVNGSYYCQGQALYLCLDGYLEELIDCGTECHWYGVGTGTLYPTHCWDEDDTTVSSEALDYTGGPGCYYAGSLQCSA